MNTLVTSIDPAKKSVACANGDVVSYDILVLATGSDAVLPKHTPGHDANGVFVYRTIEDLQKLIAYGESHKGTVGAVVGGGLLGLEAANAMMDLKSFEEIKLIERNRWVLSRQLDAEAGALVVEKVADLGVDILLSKRVGEIQTDEANNATGIVFEADPGRVVRFVRLDLPHSLAEQDVYSEVRDLLDDQRAGLGI